MAQVFRQGSSLLSQFCFNILKHTRIRSSEFSTFNKSRNSDLETKRFVRYISAFGIAGLAGLIVLWRHFWQKSENEFSDEIFHTPFVAAKTATLCKCNKMWFPKTLFPSVNSFKKIEMFPLRSDDILVVSFPKSGTTWVQQIIWLIMSKPNESQRQPLNIEQIFSYMEYEYPGLKEISKRRSPRLLKSHLPYSFLPVDVQNGKGKVIYIARNAKDVCVSYYHFHRMLSPVKYQGSFEEFFEMFISGKVSYGPWQNHVSEFWHHRNDDNLLFITYEDLHMHPVKTVRRIAEFLGKSLSDQEIFRVIQATKFERMSSDPLVNYSWWDDLGLRQKNESHFLRKGVVGDWKNYLTAEMEKEINKTCVYPLELNGLHLLDSPDVMDNINT